MADCVRHVGVARQEREAVLLSCNESAIETGDEAMGEVAAIQAQHSPLNQAWLGRAPRFEEPDQHHNLRDGSAHGGTAPDRPGMMIAPRTAARRRVTPLTRAAAVRSLLRRRWAAVQERRDAASPHWYPVAPGRDHGAEGSVAERVKLKVRGATSDQRCEAVCSALRFISGVMGIAIHRNTSEVTVVYDPHRARIEQFRVAIWAMGCRVERLVFLSEHQGWHGLRERRMVARATASPPRPRRTPRREIANRSLAQKLGALRARRARAAWNLKGLPTHEATRSQDATSRARLGPDPRGGAVRPCDATARVGIRAR